MPHELPLVMKHPIYRLQPIFAGLGLVLALAAAPSAQANVYASNVKINGGMSNITVGQGVSVIISYILNEPASGGVKVKILSGSTPVRNLSFEGGGVGTARGTNVVTWDGKTDGGTNAPWGDYKVSITAAATGYSGWTKITDDNSLGSYSWEARGIAVDRNTNSPYYGRVFVGNSSLGPNGGLGDLLGFQKLNADGSYADEGGFSDGGVAWSGGTSAPWRIRVSEDDQVYVQDYHAAGDIYRFDPKITSTSMVHVFAPPTDQSSGRWSGFCVVGKGSNTVLWGSDARISGSVGISKFAMKPDGTFDPSAGINVVKLGGTPGLDDFPFAVDVDKAGAIYTLQQHFNQGDSSTWAFRFPAYDPATNGAVPEATAQWVAGPGNDYCGGFGIAADPTGTYVAACFWGYDMAPPLGRYTNGNIKILHAGTGTVVTNLDIGIDYPNTWTDDPAHHMDTDCDWDAVGNLYYLDDWGICWRAFSPPGTNQATTVALPVVTLASPVIYITNIGASNGLITIDFTGAASDSATVFAVLSTPVANGTNWSAASAVITGSGGSYQATVPANGPRQFYRIQRLAVPALRISSINVSAGVATINFTGSSTDSQSAFTLRSSDTPNGSYSPTAGATIIQVKPGEFQAAAPVSGPKQFYRVERP
jgi:hypothetical protein